MIVQMSKYLMSFSRVGVNGRRFREVGSPLKTQEALQTQGPDRLYYLQVRNQ